MKKAKYIAQFFAQSFEPAATEVKVVYEFDLPTVVGDEQRLSALGKKHSMTFYQQIYEGELPPVRRVMGREISYTDLTSVEKSLAIIDKAIVTSNFRMPSSYGTHARDYECYMISPDDNLLKVSANEYYWGHNLFVQGKFNNNKYKFTNFEDILSLNSVNKPVINNSGLIKQTYKLMKDSRDEEDIWTLTYYLPYATNYASGNRYDTLFKGNVDKFIVGTKELLGITNFTYGVSLG